MKFNIKTNIKEFAPIKIVPRCGPIKKLTLKEDGYNLVLSSLHCRDVNLPKNMSLNSNDFIAIGLYLAEGTTYCNPDKKMKHSGEIVFVNSHPDCIVLVRNLLNKFGISTKNLKWKIGLNRNYKDSINKEDLFDY